MQQTDHHTWYTAHYSLLHLRNIFHICPAGQKPHCIWDIDEIWFQKPFIKYVTNFGNKYALCENQNTLISTWKQISIISDQNKKKHLLLQNVIYTINITHYSKVCHTDKPIKLQMVVIRLLKYHNIIHMPIIIKPQLKGAIFLDRNIHTHTINTCISS